MKSIRLNIRALAFDGKTSLPSAGRIVYNSKTNSHDVTGSGGASLAKFGVLRMRDLVVHEVIAATDYAYASWVGHSGQAGVTSFVARSYYEVRGQRVSTSPALESDPSTGTGPVGPFSLRPSDELALTGNAGGEQIVALELLVGTVAEVESLFKRG
jgi:hypothetical protein